MRVLALHESRTKPAITLQASVLVSCLACVAACSAGGPPTDLPTVQAIVARMAQARAENQAHLRPYTVTRSYQMFDGDKHEPKARVTADVSFAPPDRKSFIIQDAKGSGWGEKVVHRILESEVAATRETSTDFTEANYDFSFVREENMNGHRCFVLSLSPKRQDKGLLRGNIWVDAETYLLRRVEGSPAKNPSWWVKNVHVVLLFGHASGMWMQTELEATADVRILGQNTLTSQDTKVVVSDGAAAVTEAQDKQSRDDGL